jgi:ATP-dependent protease HslVU (ClpYQ) peptidase subunit
MTTILGIQGDGFAVIGVDSRVSDVPDDGVTTQIVTLTETNSKVASNGRYLIGAAGDVRAINILHHAFKPPECPPNLRGKKLDHFFTVKFIPALMECFDTQKYSQPQNENSLHLAEQGSSIIVAINGVIYVVDGDYSWASDMSAIYAIGTGAQYALGAAFTLVGKTKPALGNARKIVMKSLAAAAKFDPNTGAPFHIHVQGKEPEPRTKRAQGKTTPKRV